MIPGELEISEASELFSRFSKGDLSLEDDEVLPSGEDGAAILLERYRKLRLPLSRRESFV